MIAPAMEISHWSTLPEERGMDRRPMSTAGAGAGLSGAGAAVAGAGVAAPGGGGAGAGPRGASEASA